MQQARAPDLAACGVTMPPTQDELPSSDGMPMETHRHVLQTFLLTDALALAWAGRRDVFIGANMFVYFSPNQVLTHDYRGPDIFVVVDVPQHRVRKSWVVWEEGKGPDVVIELLSESTAHLDKTETKLIYQDRLRVPEYFWYDPYSGELAGFVLRDGKYEPIAAGPAGRLPSRRLDQLLSRWDGVYRDEQATWLRWATPDGTLLPTAAERAEQAERRLAELEARLAGPQGQPPDVPGAEQ
jgi:Uma2 family endonuclease